MANVSITPRRRSVVDHLDAWFAGRLKALKEVKARAELERKLRGADDHLLRDLGLNWTGSRYERIVRDDDGQ